MRRAAGLLAVALLLLGACADGEGDDDAVLGATTTTAREDDGGDRADDRDEDDDDGDDGAAEGRCPAPSGDAPDVAPATARELEPADDDDPTVLAVVYPHPDYEAELWSQWGQGLVLPDGRHVSAIGDHCGVNGNAYLYVFDPETEQLELVSDVLSVTGHQPGAWGYGKVHGQLVPGPDGEIYATTYWGTRRGLVYGDGYEGDVLLRFDPDSGEVESLGPPLPGYGVPSLAGDADAGLLYGEAVDPESDPDAGAFFVYDVEQERVVYETDEGDHVGFRNVLVGPDGTAYVSAGEGRLRAYDPDDGELRPVDARLPGERLRSSTRPGPDGTVYGVTDDPGQLFALRPSGEIDVLGPVRGDTASLALHPDGDRAFYVPDAHGGSWEQGTPLISVDTETGDEEVVVELNELAEEQLGLRLGGTYNVAVDPSGDRVYIGMNAGDPDGEEAFGEVVLVVVELP